MQSEINRGGPGTCSNFSKESAATHREVPFYGKMTIILSKNDDIIVGSIDISKISYYLTFKNFNKIRFNG
jgi:hypothetical protein